jgi:hypothetical protein
MPAAAVGGDHKTTSARKNPLKERVDPWFCDQETEPPWPLNSWVHASRFVTEPVSAVPASLENAESSGGRECAHLYSLRIAPLDLPHRGRLFTSLRKSLRKEVIQPQVLLRLPCYDFVPVISLAVGTFEIR